MLGCWPSLFSRRSSITKQRARLRKQPYCYFRLASPSHRNELQHSIDSMKVLFPTHQVVVDVGSGINFNRSGFRSLMELSYKGLVTEIVIFDTATLCSYAFELVEWLLHMHGTRVVVLTTYDDRSSAQNDIAYDIFEFIIGLKHLSIDTPSASSDRSAPPSSS